MSLLPILDQLDQEQSLLEEEFPECKIGYSYRPGRVIWTAQLGPVLNKDSPDALREAIKRAYVEVLEKIGEQMGNAPPAATGEPEELAADEASSPPVTEP